MQSFAVLQLMPAAGTMASSLLERLEQVVEVVLLPLRFLFSKFDDSRLREISRGLDQMLQNPENLWSLDVRAWIFMVAALFLGILGVSALRQIRKNGIFLDATAFAERKRTTVSRSASFAEALIGYFRSLLRTFLEAVILLCVISALVTAIFVLCKIAWYAYIATPVGRYYTVYFPHRAQLMGTVLGRDILLFPPMVTLACFGAAMAVSAVCRVVYVTRYLYLSRGMLGKIIGFALPLNLLAAAFVRMLSPPVSHWGCAYAAALLPTLLVFSYCFRFAMRLLPEIGMLFAPMRRRRRNIAHAVFLRDVDDDDKIIEFDPLSGVLTGRKYQGDEEIHTQGLLLSRGGHTFILYRYGHDLFFQVDDRELSVAQEMSVKWGQWGRYGRRFSLYRDSDRLFRLTWLDLPLIGPTAATAAFFGAFADILKNRSGLEDAFTMATPEPIACPAT